MDHLDEFTLLRLVDKEIDDERRSLAEQHLSNCVSCLRRFEGFQAETLLVSSALWDSDGKIPAPFRPKSELPWMVAGFLGAAAVGLATFWTRILRPALSSLQTFGVDGSSFASDIFNREVLARGASSAGQLVLEFVVLALILVAVYGLARGGFGRRGGTGSIWLLPMGQLFSVLKMVALSTGLGMGLLATSGEAAIVEWSDGVYELAEDEVIDNDLIVAGEDIRIAGTVRGDLIVFGRRVRIDTHGHIEGDIIGAAQNIEIYGTVDGNVRTGSQALEINGRVLRNVSSAAERLFFEPEASMGGSLTAAGREVRIRANIPKDITVAMARGEIDADVGGSIRAVGDAFVVGPKANIQGDLFFHGAEPPELSPDARVASVEFSPIEEEEPRSAGDRILSFVLSWAAALAFGAVVLWAAPLGWGRVLSHMSRVPWNLVFGLIALIAIPIISIFLGLTLVGLPISIALFCVYGFAVYSSQIFVGHWMGNHLLGPGNAGVPALTRLAIGLIVVQIARTLPVIGGVMTLVFIVWGLGAIVRARFALPGSSAIAA